MRYEVTSLGDVYEPICNDELGPIWALTKVTISGGHYLTKNGLIFSEGLHENFGAKWLAYWLSTRGATFGGVQADDLYLIGRGEQIQFCHAPESTEKIEGTVYVFQYTYDHNFHHFLMAALPRLAHYACGSFGGGRVAVRNDTPGYQLEMIQMFVPDEKLIWLDPAVEYLCENVLIAPFPQWVSKAQINNFYMKALNLDAKGGSKGVKRVFLSRADAASKRPLANALQLSEVMKKYEVHEVEASRLSLSDRLDTFGGAEIIIGVFSAGFANLVFATQCKLVIFIEHPAYRVPNEYKAICGARRIKLRVLRPSARKRITHILRAIVRRSIRLRRDNVHNAQAWSVDVKRLDRMLSRLSSST